MPTSELVDAPTAVLANGTLVPVRDAATGGLKKTTMAAIASFVGGGGSGGMSPFYDGVLTKPIASDFALNSSNGGSIINLASRGIRLIGNPNGAGSLSVAGAEKTVSFAGDFDFRAFIHQITGNFDQWAEGIFCRFTDGPQYQTWGMRNTQLQSFSFNNMTAVNANSNTNTNGGGTEFYRPMWYRLARVSGTLHAYYSFDGEWWHELWNYGRATTLIGVGIFTSINSAWMVRGIDCYSLSVV
jgi:hypothetical protein